VKEFGYNLSDEPGYFAGDAAVTWASTTTSQSYQHASRIRDFCCPVDEGPRKSAHVIPTSFSVCSFFAGRNIMNMTMEANRTLAVSEIGTKRHPSGSGDELERNYVFADLSATLGYNGPVFQGMRLRAWNKGSLGGIVGAAESSLPDPDFEEIHSGRLYWDWNWAQKLAGKLGTSGRNDWFYNAGRHHTQGWHTTHTWQMFRVCARVDGLLQFPAAGNWDFWTRGDVPEVSFGVGTSAGSPANIGDDTSLTYQTKPRWRHDTWHTWVQVKPNADPDAYYKFVGVYLGDGDWQGLWGVYWRNQDPVTSQWNPDYNGATGAEVNAKHVFFLP